MKRSFSAIVSAEGGWFVAQCLEIDVASQGESVESALTNLREALELYFEEPGTSTEPTIHRIEIDVAAA